MEKTNKRKAYPGDTPEQEWQIILSHLNEGCPIAHPRKWEVFLDFRDRVKELFGRFEEGIQ